MAPPNSETKAFFDLAQQNWHKPFGLITAIVAALLFDTAILGLIAVDKFIIISIYSVSVVAVSIVWWLTNRIEKTPQGKVGIVVSIACSNNDEHRKVREDFILSLRNLLKEGPLGDSFYFIEIPQHIAVDIVDQDQAIKLKEKTRSHFVIFGRVRLRRLNNKDCYILKLKGVVGHRPLNHDLGTKLKSEFSELFPQNVSIETDNDLISFEFTSEWTEFVAKYIIGIAAFCSGDLDYAERLYDDLSAKLDKKSDNFDIYKKIKKRLPLRFLEIHKTKALIALERWFNLHDEQSLLDFSDNVNKIGPDNDDYSMLLLRSIESFLRTRDVRISKKYLAKCKNCSDDIWILNSAFLEAYGGNLKKTIQLYRKCENTPLHPDTIDKIENFLFWIVNDEPEKIQIYYCLGFFNWKIKGDELSAIKDLNHFLEKCSSNQFEAEQKLAKQWISKLQESIKIEN